MTKKGSSYRPIDGQVVGVVEDVQDLTVYWRHKDTVFLIPMERFTEYFEEVASSEGPTDTDQRSDRQHPV